MPLYQPAATTLTVEEEDGSPSVAGVTKIQVPNATLTNDSGTIVSLGYTGYTTPGDFSGMTMERSVQPISDWAAAYDLTAADERGIPLGYLLGGRGGGAFFSDCWYNTSTQFFEGGITADVSGTGAALAALAAGALVNHPGVISLSTGTTTTGSAGIRQVGNGGAILLGGGKVRCGVVAKVEALSDGTETFTVRLGLHDNTAAAESVDGVLFRYTHSVNAGEWQGVCRSNSVESTLDTNTLADTNWHTFEFEVNALATSVEFFIDGTSTGTIATNIPSGASRFTAFMPGGIVKSAGTTARLLDLDAYWLHYEFTTAR